MLNEEYKKSEDNCYKNNNNNNNIPDLEKNPYNPTSEEEEKLIAVNQIEKNNQTKTKCVK